MSTAYHGAGMRVRSATPPQEMTLLEYVIAYLQDEKEWRGDFQRSSAELTAMVHNAIDAYAGGAR